MATPARFKVGTSGSGKHTETHGPGDEGHVGPSGPRIGAGVEGRRVTPEYDRSGKSDSPKVRDMKKYSEG